jgi:hypothetical protein
MTIMPTIFYSRFGASLQEKSDPVRLFRRPSHKQYDQSGPWTVAGGVQPGDWPAWMRSFKDY